MEIKRISKYIRLRAHFLYKSDNFCVHGTYTDTILYAISQALHIVVKDDENNLEYEIKNISNQSEWIEMVSLSYHGSQSNYRILLSPMSSEENVGSLSQGQSFCFVMLKHALN